MCVCVCVCVCVFMEVFGGLYKGLADKVVVDQREFTVVYTHMTCVLRTLIHFGIALIHSESCSLGSLWN